MATTMVRQGGRGGTTPAHTRVVRATTTTNPPKTVTPAQLQGDIANLESQIRGLQSTEAASQQSTNQALANQQGTLDTLGSAINGTNGTTAPSTTPSTGILSSLTSGGATTYLVIAGVAVVAFLGYRWYRSRQGR
jgi:hypothetical protein